MISDSLLASARVLPASSAASVGRRPTAPVMPLSTTSHASAAASVEASSPSPEYAGANSATCASNSSSLEPPAVSPTTRNRSGLARTRSRAWVPMEPVEPRMTMSRALTGQSSVPGASNDQNSSPPRPRRRGPAGRGDFWSSDAPSAARTVSTWSPCAAGRRRRARRRSRPGRSARRACAIVPRRARLVVGGQTHDAVSAVAPTTSDVCRRRRGSSCARRPRRRGRRPGRRRPPSTAGRADGDPVTHSDAEGAQHPGAGADLGEEPGVGPVRRGRSARRPRRGRG